MKTISHREMRNNSGAMLREVAAGERFLVTNDGLPVAMIIPAPVDDYERLVAEGVIIPARDPQGWAQLLTVTDADLKATGGPEYNAVVALREEDDR